MFTLLTFALLDRYFCLDWLDNQKYEISSSSFKEHIAYTRLVRRPVSVLGMGGHCWNDNTTIRDQESYLFVGLSVLDWFENICSVNKLFEGNLHRHQHILLHHMHGENLDLVTLSSEFCC